MIKIQNTFQMIFPSSPSIYLRCIKARLQIDNNHFYHLNQNKNRTTCLSVFSPLRKTEKKSVTVLKLCERSFKWDLSGCPNSNRLEMALGWRQVVRNLEIYYVILRGYLYSNIKIKRIELDICSWRHFKENLKLFNLPMDIEYQR